MHDAPSTAQYETALKSMDLAKAISPTSRKLLRTLYAGPEHSLTTMKIAREMGWDTHGGVNLHYGKFAQALAKRMRWPVPKGSYQVATIATFEGGSADSPHTRWTMRPELVVALEALRLVIPARAKPPQA